MTTPEAASPPSLLRSGLALLRLTRPLNALLAALGLTVGGLLSAGPSAFSPQHLPALALAIASGTLVGAGANALNDVMDVEVDRVNRPRRPLPSGLLSIRAAWVTAVCCTLAALALAAWLSATHLALAAASAALLAAYDVQLKGTPFWGNLVVALILGVALIYGGLAVGPAPPAAVGAAFAFLATLAREVVKDVEDVAGDARSGLRTLPLVVGQRAALLVALGLVLLTVALTPLPYLLLGYEELYLLIVLLADAVLLRAAWLLTASRRPASHRARQASQALKVAMALGLAALAAHGFVGTNLSLLAP